MTAQAYSKDGHTRAVKAAAREAGLKGAAGNVLAYLCDVSDWKKPIVRVSRAKIEERTTYCDKTIKAALSVLRKAGFIEAVAYATGGRGYCPVYVIRTTKGGENFPPLDGEDLAKGGKKLPVKGGKNFQQRGEKTSPPSLSLHSSNLKGEGAAQGGGIECTPLDEQSKQELALFSRECSLHGYTEAARRKDQRESLRAGGGGL